jgi:hypothetical protein
MLTCWASRTTQPRLHHEQQQNPGLAQGHWEVFDPIQDAVDGFGSGSAVWSIRTTVWCCVSAGGGSYLDDNDDDTLSDGAGWV